MNQFSIRCDMPSTKPDMPEFPHGWMGNGNKRLLANAVTPKTKIVLELGAWLGMSTLYLADITTSDCVIISVDLWNDGGVTIKENNATSKIPTNVMKNLFDQYCVTADLSRILHESYPFYHDNILF